ncbi:heparinase II/III family protein [Chitinophaga sp. Cy-1792]|uniref:heparinase II/III domain-containing protein n=1 Tax=Chitinophaga sp. Cy-1792 TaxID=2608339 RepID=UPI001423AD2E|nr:heparinase II/III family protein [Chitinophaga sp. Cy-1792]NIG53339.1 heparinase [Chitinophaga sp. Cy-1792]
MRLIKLFHVLTAAVMALSVNLQAQSKPAPSDFLEKAWQQAGGATAFAGRDAWRNELKSTIQQRINTLPAATKAGLIEDAEKALTFKWPAVTADLYLQYRDNGNRINFETVQGERRRMMVALIAGELVEHKGRFMPQIANGLWLVLEESTWVLPAHIGVQKSGANLPDPSEQIIDLVAGETAVTLSWAQFLLREDLDKYSVIINKRIDYELDRRIYTPYLQRDDFWWMGFKGGQVNNWNIWINNNILKTALLNLDNTDKRNAVIAKSIRSADNFVNAYAPDGGCDEGPSYWGHAGGKLIEMLESLQSASGGKLDFSKNPLMHAIGAYIYKMHVDSNRFVNFADASARSIPPPQDVFMYGQLYHDTLLTKFGSYLYGLGHPDKERLKASALAEFVYELLLGDDIRRTPAAAPYTAVNWLPDLQVLSLRSRAGTPKGLFLAAQGGHNAESHNHNDVGNFVLYVNGQPAIIDVGVGTYTKQTFSKDRYQLWYMQSQWHNCPTINGIQQQDGRRFQAGDVSFKQRPDGGLLKMDIAKAYPEAALVNSWVRTWNFTANNATVVLTDEYDLKEWKEAFRCNLMSPQAPDTSKAGVLVIKGNGNDLVVNYDPALLEVTTTQQPIDDPRLSSVWGNSVTRISMVAKKQQLRGKYTIKFALK